MTLGCGLSAEGVTGSETAGRERSVWEETGSCSLCVWWWGFISLFNCKVFVEGYEKLMVSKIRVVFPNQRSE